MREFARLYLELDASTGTNAKLVALQRYLAHASDRDAAWAVYFLAGGKPRQSVASRALREFSVAASGLPEWLFNECYEAVGDLAETIALLLPPATRESTGTLADWIERRFCRCAAAARPRARAAACLCGRTRHARTLPADQADRRRIPRRRVAATGNACARLARRARREGRRAAHDRIYRHQRAADGRAVSGAHQSRRSRRRRLAHPYPFFLAHALTLPLERFAEELGPPDEWLVEWKYDGIRAQLVKRAGQSWLWSRGEELITERFPEMAERPLRFLTGRCSMASCWCGAMARRNRSPCCRQRITRKSVTAKVLRTRRSRSSPTTCSSATAQDWRDRRRPNGARHSRRSLAPAASWFRPSLRRQAGRSWLRCARSRDRAASKASC